MLVFTRECKDIDRIIRLSKSLLSIYPATSLTPPQPTMSRIEHSSSPFQLLPAEIITTILEYLPPQSLANLSRSCHLMRAYCKDDFLWARLVQGNLPVKVDSPYPCDSWRDLYLAHHPYWFLTRHKIWFADRAMGGNTMTGALIIARYDPRRGCIEGYRLVAEQGKHTFKSWSWNSSVIIHIFDPRVQLWLDDPVIKLDLGRETVNDLRKERTMRTSSAQGLRSALFLSQTIPHSLQHRSMALWPPSIVPAKHRVRTESNSMFRDAGHKPKTLDAASDQAFRIRKWLSFYGMDAHLGVRVGEDVMTFATLLEESYIPTDQKPWQGIWVGDYSGHGCEFLLVLQKDVDPKTRPISPATWTMDDGDLLDASSDEDFEGGIEDTESGQELSNAPLLPGSTLERGGDTAGPACASKESNEPSCRGRLEAIKLTGDPNVPRGQYTWIAEDIGPKGLLRVADEEIFKDARVVRSFGHVAAQGFRNGMH